MNNYVTKKCTMNGLIRKIYIKNINFAICNYHYIILFIVVLSAFLLRIWGIWNVSNQDEYNEVFEALRVCSGQLNLERWVKRFYLYILSFAYGVYYLIGWVLQVFDSPIDFATKTIRNMDPLFLIGRSISSIFGAASVFMTYLIAKSLFNPTVGLIASLFLCLNVVNIEVSHFATVEATLCLMVLISFYSIAQLIRNNRNYSRYYLLSGLFSGIAFQNKAPAIILGIPFLLSHIFRSVGKKPFHYIYSKELCYYAFSLLLGLTVGNPAILFAPQSFLKSLLGYTHVYTTPINVTQSEHIGYIAYLIYFYKELGLLLTIIASYSLIKAVFSKRQTELLLLSFIIPFYLLMGASKFMVYSRYMVPLMPFLYILCAKYLTQMVQDLRLKQNLSRGLLIMFCLLVFIHPFLNAMKFERLVSGKDTRILAKQWIEENIPFGSKILMDSGKSINTTGPKIAENRESIIRRLAYQKKAIEENDGLRSRGKVNGNALIYYELMIETTPEESYDITSTKFGLEVKSIDYYMSQLYQYFIITKSVKDRARSELIRRTHPEVSQFYSSLDTDTRIELIKTIGPTNTNRGHTYHIYKLSSAH